MQRSSEFGIRMDQLARKRPLPVLEKANHVQWFKLAMMHFQAEGIEHVLTQKMDEYVLVVEKVDIDPATGKPEGRYVLSIEEKRKQWKKDDAKVRYILTICLNEYDQEDCAEHINAKESWTYLEKKYLDKRPSVGDHYLVQLMTYKMKAGDTIEDAWGELSRIRRQIRETKPEMAKAFEKNELFQRLLAALPDGYGTIRDSLDAQINLDVDVKIQMLKDKEDRMNMETCLWGNTKKTPRRQRSNESMKDVDAKPTYKRKPKQKIQCFICDKDHMVTDCEFLEGSRKYAARVKLRRDKKKVKGYSAKKDETDSDTGDDSGDESDPEVAAISKSQICEIPTSKWVADTGASSHMTDQLQLFRGPLTKIRKRTITVGGGKLFASQMGTVELRVDGGCVQLKNTLFVPKLGVNLLSGFRLCNSGLRGNWDDRHLYLYNKQGTEVIRASRSGGVYIVDKVAKGIDHAYYSGDPNGHESAFTNYEHQNSASEMSEEESGSQINSARRTPKSGHGSSRGDVQETEEELTESQQARYQLWHRRFGHLGPEKLRSIHKSVDIKKPIPIPATRCICQVCQLTKMRNRVSKKLSPWNDELLGLISIDIAGPFPPSLTGNIYFLEIVENSTRKVWIIPMKSKDAAIEKLNQWKITTELQTGKKVQSVRSDNDTELKKLLNSWSKEYGITPQYTVTYSSNQNGVAERAIQTTENSVRAMLKDAKLPLEFWDEAASTDAYIRNRTASGPILEGEVLTPEEAFSGKRPDINHLRVWGSKCFSYINPKSLPAKTRHDKFMDRGRIAVFMGYVETTIKLYRVYAPDLGYVTVTSVINVDEDTPGGDVDLNLRTTTMNQNRQGTVNELPIRRPRGRPSGVTIASGITMPNVQVLPETEQEHQKSALERQVNSSHVPDDSTNISPPEPKRGRGRPKKMTEIEVDKPDTTDDMEDVEIELPLNLEPEPDTSNQHMVVVEVPPVTGKRYHDDDSDGDDDRRNQRRKINAYIATMMGFNDESAFSIEELEEIHHPPRILVPEPTSYREAMNDPVYGEEWRRAVDKELESLTMNET